MAGNAHHTRTDRRQRHHSASASTAAPSATPTKNTAGPTLRTPRSAGNGSGPAQNAGGRYYHREVERITNW